jgi:hypothetical protein
MCILIVVQMILLHSFGFAEATNSRDAEARWYVPGRKSVVSFLIYITEFVINK